MNIDINYRTKQMSDQDLTISFLVTMKKVFDYLKGNEVFLTTIKDRKRIKFKTNGKDGDYLQLSKSKDKGKTWVDYGRNYKHYTGNTKFQSHNIGSFGLEYVNRCPTSWYSPRLLMKCETSLDFSKYYYNLTEKALVKIKNGESVSKEIDEKFTIYLSFIKFLSKSNRKRLIDHLYYFNNPNGTEYKRYKKFINGYLGKSLNVSFLGNNIERIDYFQSFDEIRNQRISQVLRNTKDKYENKLKDEKSTLCQRLSTIFKS